MARLRPLHIFLAHRLFVAWMMRKVWQKILPIRQFHGINKEMKDLARTVRSRLVKPVVMTGLMGAGKTKIGSMLADALDLPFVDADQEIEASAGMSITDIFARYGEPEFRDLERKIIGRLLDEGVRVISTGGGAVMTPATLMALHEKAVAVWLKVDLDVLVERTAGNEKRPLLKTGDPREILSSLMQKRDPVYAQADITVDSGSPDPEYTLTKLLEALDAHLKERA